MRAPGRASRHGRLTRTPRGAVQRGAWASAAGSQRFQSLGRIWGKAAAWLLWTEHPPPDSCPRRGCFPQAAQKGEGAGRQPGGSECAPASARELCFSLTILIPSGGWQGGWERSSCRLHSCHRARGSPSQQRKGSGEDGGCAGGGRSPPPRCLGEGRAGSSREGRIQRGSVHQPPQRSVAKPTHDGAGGEAADPSQ